MLKHLKLTNVGPAPEMELEFGERLNLLTGDNGLGKSFLLDIAWWALTEKWPADINHNITIGSMAQPNRSKDAEIAFVLGDPWDIESREHISCSFNRRSQSWGSRSHKHDIQSSIVIYSLADGSFSIWDPARNYWAPKGTRVDSFGQNTLPSGRIPAYVFSQREVWDGLQYEDLRHILCNGLIRDWAGWQKEGKKTFKRLKTVLKVLSPSEDELITPGKFTRISLNDSRDIPTLIMPYGQIVPVLHASSGIRRILALAYLIVWAWEEHQRASELLGERPARRITFLIDEVESHLHPKWQRTIIAALLSVVKSLSKNVDVQLIVSTHSPLVLASVEPFFDAEKDAWFDLDLNTDEEPPRVELTKREFVRHGDVSNWLTSEAFDLRRARSKEAEDVLVATAEAMIDENFDAKRAKELDSELRKVLSDTDPFWIRWMYIAEKKGWLSDSR